jgi:C terminal of Calcineurin-like phosphoesterase/N terminal of Calcineurin-like phosphoesterase/Calcineurin-like phosphoesterase
MPEIRKLILICVAVVMTACGGCRPEPPEPEPEDGLKITGVSIPSNLSVPVGGEIVLTGAGFAVNDIIEFVLTADTGKSYNGNVTTVTGQTATLVLPAGIASGSYRLTVRRGSESLVLGTLTINVTTGTGIPDKPGMTVKGIVFCDGEGVPGVVVSDGVEVTVTDSEGIYYLPSAKQNRFVFISLPGNYEIAASDNIPQFFKRLAGGTTVEQHDFSLVRSDNSRHVIIPMADWHLANRNDDLAQFSNGIIPDVNATISSYAGSGTKVYAVAMGDMTWDAYWYENGFRLPNYITEMKKINCPVFNLMGNHDNDPYVAADVEAELPFRELIGPTYYSFNLGAVHYVVLDNIQYINTGGSQGVIGDRNYSDVVVSAQTSWLTKDLAAISDKSTPLVILIHAPLWSNPTLDGSGQQVNNIALNNGSTLLSLVSAFEKMHFISGHTHINYTVESGSVIEHNTAAVSATWWWTGKTGYAGNHICKDGSPGGYGIWETDGRNIKWFYKSMGYPKNYQFRTYDLNTVHITAAAFAPNSTDAALAEYAGVYATPNQVNDILINVWGYDPSWTVEVKEGGTSLPVERVSAQDPLHIISYAAKRLDAGAVPTSSFVTGNTAHMFRARATSATSTLTVTVTDRFGNTYTETMNRPKAFTWTMQ